MFCGFAILYFLSAKIEELFKKIQTKWILAVHGRVDEKNGIGIFFSEQTALLSLNDVSEWLLLCRRFVVN